MPITPDSLRIIPAGWSQHHAPVIVSAMNGTCRITDPARKTAGAWDEETGTYGDDTPYVVAAAVPCRVQELKADGADGATGSVEDKRRAYLVSLPHDTPVQVDWLIDQVIAPNDPTLAAVMLHVDDVHRGTEMWDRTVVCTEHQDVTA